jgi:hypothetical protein
MTQDPRTAPLGAAAILTDTQFRLSFLPHDITERAVAMQFSARAAKMDSLQSQMKLGYVQVQIKAGFGAERSFTLSGPEIMLLMDAFDKFIHELPGAQNAEPIPE